MNQQERVLAEKLKYRLGLFGDAVKYIRRQDVKKFGGIMKHFTYVKQCSFVICEHTRIYHYYYYCFL